MVSVNVNQMCEAIGHGQPVRKHRPVFTQSTATKTVDVNRGYKPRPSVRVLFLGLCCLRVIRARGMTECVHRRRRRSPCLRLAMAWVGSSRGRCLTSPTAGRRARARSGSAARRFSWRWRTPRWRCRSAPRGSISECSALDARSARCDRERKTQRLFKKRLCAVIPCGSDHLPRPAREKPKQNSSTKTVTVVFAQMFTLNVVISSELWCGQNKTFWRLFSC